MNINIWMLTAFVSFGINIIILLVIAVILYMYPTIFTILTSKNIVWEIAGTGDLKAWRASKLYGTMKTKKGYYQYERLDVVSCEGKQGILVNESDFKALRPHLQPIFSLMKAMNIQNRESLSALMSLPLTPMAKYEEWLQKQNQSQNVEATA